MKSMLGLVLLVACTSTQKTYDWHKDPEGESTRFLKTPPLIIGHRGTAGHLPEHTLEGYELAIELGADFIEPDLVSTKDGVLIARHENDLSGTTDVDVKFPQRKTTKKIDGHEINGWFSEDFTLKEIKTLRARQGMEQRDHAFDDKYLIPTFEEILQLAHNKGKEVGRKIGVYVETKHPTYFRSIGKPLEEKMLALLKKHKLTGKNDPVFIQSFEVSNLKELRKQTSIRLIQLLDEPDWRPFDLESKGLPTTYQDMTTPAALKEMATYADGVGPWKRLIVLEDAKKHLVPATNFIAEAHKVGLLVHVYTFRSDKKYLNADYDGKPENEYFHFFKLGADGVFTDFADDGVKAKRAYYKL